MRSFVRQYTGQLGIRKPQGKIGRYVNSRADHTNSERGVGESSHHQYEPRIDPLGDGGTPDLAANGWRACVERSQCRALPRPCAPPVPGGIRKPTGKDYMERPVHRRQNMSQRCHAKRAKVLSTRQNRCRIKRQMVPEHRSGAEQHQPGNGDERYAPVRLLAHRKPGREMRRPRVHYGLPSAFSLRRINRPSSASCSGSRSARTSTSDADTASGPRERIPSTTRLDAIAMKPSSVKRDE